MYHFRCVQSQGDPFLLTWKPLGATRSLALNGNSLGQLEGHQNKANFTVTKQIGQSCLYCKTFLFVKPKYYS